MPAQPNTAAAASPGARETIIDGLGDLAWRALWTLLALTVLTAAIVAIGNSYGERLVTSGMSSRAAPLQVVIGNDVLHVPENMVRRPEQRVEGLARMIDLKVHWPDRSGFRPALVEAFADTNAETAQVVIIRLTRRQGLLDMPARLAPIYAQALAPRDAWQTAHGLAFAPLREDLGYVDETLVFSGSTDGRNPDFIARCQHPRTPGGALLLACETDLFVGEALEARVRFPEHFLANWQSFGPELRAFVDDLLLRPTP